MEFYKLNKRELAFYQQTLERNIDALSAHEDVVGVGIGYKTVGDVPTDTMCLLISVKEKRDDIPAERRIPETIDGVATDVIVEQEIEHQVEGVLPQNRFQKYETLMGGAAIINCNTKDSMCGVLGAIVFDKNTGNAMGLSAQHAIGSQETKLARKDDPIIQPPFPRVDSSEAIGNLLKFNKALDVALFELNDKRKFAAKMMCDEGDFELEEPKAGMPTLEVECSAVHTHTRGKIFSRERKYRNGKWVWLIEIEFDAGYTSTKSGDSGALWVDRKTKAPVGVHNGVKKIRNSNHSPVRNVDGSFKKRAVATCIMDVTKWHDFTFQPPKKRVPSQLSSELRVYETGFAPLSEHFYAFCYLPPSSDNLHKPVLIKKFNSSLQKTDEVDTGLYPLSPIETCVFNNCVYASWRSAVGDKITIAKLDESVSSDGQPFKLETPTRLDFVTRRKPELETHENNMVLAYSDKSTRNINIAFSSDGTSWDSFTIKNAKTRLSPALASHGGKLVLAWIDLDFKIYVVEIDPTAKEQYVNDKYVLGGQSNEDPTLVSNGTKLSLAYTDRSTKKLMLVEGANRRALFGTPTTKSDVARTSAPSMFYFNGKQICHRPTTSVAARSFLASSNGTS